MGVNIGVTQFHTQFTNVSRHSGVQNRKKKTVWQKKSLRFVTKKKPELSIKTLIHKIWISRLFLPLPNTIMQYGVFITQCVVYSVFYQFCIQCNVAIAYFILSSEWCVVCSFYFVRCRLQSEVCDVQYILLQYVVCSVQCLLCSVQCIV